MTLTLIFAAVMLRLVVCLVAPFLNFCKWFKYDWDAEVSINAKKRRGSWPIVYPRAMR